ncbi:MAG: hypothetical protein IPN72_19220 [Saprospiraceae bacterium]|nr:hypothetical protein [Saprospiraceae bacterium]
MHAVILYATFSGSGKGVKVANQLSQVLTEAGIQFSIFENDWPADLSTYQCAIVAGGDGTINYYFNKYQDRCLPVILLPGGTGNDFYWTLYGNRTITQQIDDILLLLEDKKPLTFKEVDIAQCVIDQQKTKYFNNSLGLGFDGAVLQNMQAIRLIGGHLGYMLAVIKNIFTFKEITYQLRHGKHSSEIKATLLNVANSPRTGGGFMISPHAKIDDGLVNVLHCSVPGIMARLGVLTKVERGKHLGQKNLHYFPTDKISISTTTPVKGQIDGDLIEGKYFEISMAKWKARIVIFNKEDER